MISCHLPLLIDYLKTIKAMQLVRYNPQLYAEIDKHRAALHDKILKACGKTRDDQQFALELATFSEDFLDNF